MTYNIKNGKENTKEMDYNNSSGRIIVIHILSIFSFPVFMLYVISLPLAQGYCVAIVSLFLLEHDFEQDEIRKALLIKQETEWSEWFCSFF